MVKFVEMASILHKRVRFCLSLILTVGIFTPSLVKLSHAIYGHSQEKHCVAYGTDHIHSADIGCDFHDFTLASKVLFTSSFDYEPLDLPEFGHCETHYSLVFKPFKKEFHALRGPPQTSLLISA